MGGPSGGLTQAQAALIPSPSLPMGAQLTYLTDQVSRPSLGHNGEISMDYPQFTTLSLSLFAALSSGAPLPTAAIYDALASVDAKLVALLPLVAEHQRRERRVQQLVNTLRSQERAWKDGAEMLHASIAALDPIVKSGKLDRAAIAASDPATTELSSATILSYARLLAPFTSAPPSSLYPPDQKLAVGSIDPSGRALPAGALPPFPTEGAMRRGRLPFGQTEDGGMGETSEVGGTYCLWRVKNKADVFPCAFSIVRKEAKEPEVRKPDPGEQLGRHAKQQEKDDSFDFALELDL